MLFNIDNRTEGFLSFLGVKYEYSEAVKYIDLSEEWRVTNLGRPEVVDDDAVQEYALMMEAGSIAPAVILAQEPGGFDVLDGVQRLHAAELCGATSFAAYICNKNTRLPTKRKIRVFASSRINGQHTPDRSFVLRSAVKQLFFEHKCCSDKELAKLLGRNVADVTDEIRFQKTSGLIEQTGFDPGQLKKHVICSIGQCADQTDWNRAAGPLKAFCETMAECKFPNGASKHIIEDFFDVKRVQSKDRHTQFASKLVSLKKNPEVIAKLDKVRHRDPSVKLLAAMRSVNTILRGAINKGIVLQDEDFAKLVASQLRLIYSGCKEITPREVQYSGRRNASIYDKG